MADSTSEWHELGARLAEARRAAGLNQGELATAVGLDRTAVTRIERGERKLDSLELARMARALARPIDWFLRPPVPAAVSRRESRDATQDSDADVLLDGLARDVALLIEVKTLAAGSIDAPRVLDGVAAAESAARDVRRSLGLPAGPVWELQRVAERVGMFAFCLDLQSDSLDGSYLRIADAGVALVNGRAPSGRRRFTLVHELGHHVFADDFSAEWIVGTDGDDRERLINAFVIHFLMPREDVVARWAALADDGAGLRTAGIVLGAEFGVSWTAVLAHLTTLRLIDESTRLRLESARPTRADYLENALILREDLPAPSVPPRFAQAAVRAYRRHKIGRSRTIDLLRGTVSPADLPAEDLVPPDAMRSQLELD